MLVMHERTHRAMFWYRVMHKGVDEAAAKLIAADLDPMGVRKAVSGRMPSRQ